MSKRVDRTGLTYLTNEGYLVKIVEYRDANSLTVEFENGVRRESSIYRLELGSVKNPFHKTMYGIGFFGDGIYKNLPKTYQTWNDMFSRCYGKEISNCYIGCSVHPDWYNFQNFAKWYKENFNPEFMQKWHLDKDILVPGNKVYGPKTCCFVPREINNLLINQNICRNSNLPTGVSNTSKGLYSSNISIYNKTINLGTFKTVEKAIEVYKTSKEKQIKILAQKWKSVISKELYLVLINYKL